LDEDVFGWHKVARNPVRSPSHGPAMHGLANARFVPALLPLVAAECGGVSGWRVCAYGMARLFARAGH